jgi:hypothetical protein
MPCVKLENKCLTIVINCDTLGIILKERNINVSELEGF